MAMERPMSTATAVRKAMPAVNSRACSARVSWVMLTSIAGLSRDPDRGGGAPDREAEEEVGHHDRDDRAADGPPDRRTDAGGTARCGVAVVAVDQDDRDSQEEQLHERVEHVDRRQELEEVVVVS